MQEMFVFVYWSARIVDNEVVNLITLLTHMRIIGKYMYERYFASCKRSAFANKV